MQGKLTYEQSKQIFSKQNALDGGGFSDGASLKKFQLFEIFVIFGIIFVILEYGFTIAPQFMFDDPDAKRLLSASELEIMVAVSKFIEPIFYTMVAVLEVMLIVGIFLNLSLPQRIMYAQVEMYGLILPLFLISLIPMVGGIALAATGVLGLVLQVIMGAAIMYSFYHRDKIEMQQKLSGEGEVKDRLAVYNKWYRALSPFMLLFIILNINFFHIGTFDGVDPNLLFQLTGLAPIILFIVFGAVSQMMYTQRISNRYFLKYANRYKADYNFTEAEWYGESRARRVAKRH